MHDPPFLARQSSICLSLFIHCNSISPLSLISLIADIFASSLGSNIWQVLLALLCKDFFSVYVVICEVVGINDNSS